jgi:hypothetical protein
MMLDEQKPFTIWRALRSPEFYLLLVGCMAAVAGVGIVVSLLVAGLSISSLHNPRAAISPLNASPPLAPARTVVARHPTR